MLSFPALYIILLYFLKLLIIEGEARELVVQCMRAFLFFFFFSLTSTKVDYIAG